MPALVTDQFRIFNANNLVSSIEDTSNSFYIFLSLPNPTSPALGYGRTDTWNTSTSGAPSPIDNFNYTNHTYDVIGAYVPTKEMGGGSGLKYAASTIIHLSKKKEKDGTDIVGNLIKAKTAKSRLSKENKDVTVRLYYDERGLDRYYGLLELGEIGGLWKNVAGRYEIDGKKVYAKAIYKDPEAYFTPEVMEKLDEIAKEEFSYGS